jgi:hypothetical protein
MSTKHDILEGLEGYTQGPWAEDSESQAFVGSGGVEVIGTCNCCGLWGHNKEKDWELIRRAPLIADELRKARARITELEERVAKLDSELFWSQNDSYSQSFSEGVEIDDL